MENSNKDTVVHLLVINSNTPKVTSQRFAFDGTHGQNISEFILTTLNEHGKGAHILMKRSNQFYLAYHTSTGKTKSTAYHEEKVDYHPHMHELL